MVFPRILTSPRRADAILALILVGVCVGLFHAPSGFEDRLPAATYVARARVLSVDDSGVRRAALLKYGHQDLEVQILGGPFADRVTRASNQLLGKLELDEMYSQGAVVLVEFTLKDDEIWNAVARGYYRIGTELVLLGLFVLLVIGFGGWIGVKAIVSFAFTALMIWKVMIPSFLKGYDPILIGLGVVILLTGAVCFLIGGLNRKGLATFLGAFLGLVTTWLLATVFLRYFRLHGAVRPFAEMLLYSGFPHLDLTKIFVAGVFTASAGAVMDLAMDISAATYEVARRKPNISFRELLASAMAVGRAVIGTMTTTLLLAYSGGYVTMLMVFMARGVPLPNVFNLHMVSAEVLNTLAGSFGLVTVAPFTALVSALLFRNVGVRTPQRAEHADAAS